MRNTTNTRTAKQGTINEARSSGVVISLLDQELTKAVEGVTERLRHLGDGARLVTSMFEKLVCGTVAGHTIFGTKPLSAVHLQVTPTKDSSEVYITLEEWHAWLQGLESGPFVSPSLVIRRSEGFSGPPQHGELLVYNHDLVKQTVERYQDCFKPFSATPVTSEEILNSLDKTREFKAICGGDHESIGILLGYGQNSARAYARLQHLDPSQHSEEWHELNQRLRLTAYRNGERHPSNPHYRYLADDPEAKAAFEQFQRTSDIVRKISAAYPISHVALALWSGELTAQTYSRLLSELA